MGQATYNWEFGAGIQREILPRVSVDVGYFRRWYGNFIVTDNTSLAASDYTKFSITAPTVAGLSTSGQTITGLFDPNSTTVTNLTTLASVYGNQYEHWNGIDVSVNARLENGMFFFGGFNTGKTMVDNCEVAAKVPESLNVTPVGAPAAIYIPLQFCHTESPFLTQVKLNGAYQIPKVAVVVSATFQSIPGPPVQGQTTVTERAPGVPLVGSSTQTVGIVPFDVNGFLTVVGSEYGDRLNQVDFRISKLLRFAKTRTMINLDVFNVFNGSTVTTENVRIGAFRQPTNIMLGRFVKIGAQFDF